MDLIKPPALLSQNDPVYFCNLTEEIGSVRKEKKQQQKPKQANKHN